MRVPIATLMTLLAWAALPSAVCGGPPADHALEYLWEAESDVRLDGAADVPLSTHAVSARMPVYRGRFGDWAGSVRLGARWTRFDAPAGTGLDRELYTLRMPLALRRPVGRNMVLNGMIAPELSGDFKAIDRDSVDMMAMVMLLHGVQPELQLTYGILFSPGIADGIPIPVAGVLWRPTPSWTLGLVMPRPAIMYAPTRDRVYSLYARLDGGLWRVHGEPGVGDFDFETRQVHLGGGVETKLTHTVRLRLEAAVALAREIAYRDAAGDHTVEPDPAFVTGLTLQFQ